MTNYSRGANFERRLCKHLIGQGFRAHRTAGSHTPIDVIAGIDGKCYAFQCQLDKYFAPVKVEALIDEAKAYGAIPMLAWRDKGKIVLSEPLTVIEVKKI